MKPVPVLTPDEVRAVEKRGAPKGASLMEQAGAAAANAARRLAADTGAPILVVAGPGNNGGDAWVAAAHLRESFHRVTVLDATGAEPRAPEARSARAGFVSRGGAIERAWPESAPPALVVDGLLGVGLDRDVEAAFRALIERINASAAPVLALDVPSGLDSGTGLARGAVVRATRTITFLAQKVGLHMADGLDCRGEVELADLGMGDAVEREARGWLLTPELAAPWLQPRARNTHKGDFGALAIVGGNRGMVGAALLAGRAGLLGGAGKVRVALLAPDALAVDPAHPELMLSSIDDALESDVIVAGPGAGRSPSATSASMFERTVLPGLFASPKPLVIDADAINAIAFNESLRNAFVAKRKGPTLLTPHPAEAARLLGRETAAVQSHRLESALELARRFHAHVVLKGAGSVCAFPDGRWSVNTTGNPGLASGGSGDVLAGLIGAMLAQGLIAEKALQYAVCLHGAAADACVAGGAGPAGLTASEVALAARGVMNDWAARGAAR